MGILETRLANGATLIVVTESVSVCEVRQKDEAGQYAGNYQTSSVGNSMLLTRVSSKVDSDQILVVKFGAI